MNLRSSQVYPVALKEVFYFVNYTLATSYVMRPHGYHPLVELVSAGVNSQTCVNMGCFSSIG